MTSWKNGRMEIWKDGNMERWKDGKMERWGGMLYFGAIAIV
jgi:hypothetical protein